MKFCLKLALRLKQHVYKYWKAFFSFAATNQWKHVGRNLMYRSKLLVAYLLLKFRFGCVLANFPKFANQSLVFGLILGKNFGIQNLNLWYKRWCNTSDFSDVFVSGSGNTKVFVDTHILTRNNFFFGGVTIFHVRPSLCTKKVAFKKIRVLTRWKG